MSQTPAVGSPFRNHHFTVLWFAMLAFEVSNLLMVQLPGFLASIGLTEGFIGVMYSTSGVAALVARPWLGRVIDLRSRRTVMIVTAGVNATLLTLLAIPDSLTPLLWIVFVAWRMTQIALFAVMLTVASDVLRPERRTQGLALFGLSGLIALTTGGLIGDLVREAVGFSGLFLTAAALAATSLVVKSFIPEQALAELPTTKRRSFWYALAQRDLLPLWLVTFTFAIGMEALFTFLRTYVDVEQVGSFGLYFFVYGGLAALIRIFGSSALDVFDPRRLLVVTILVYGVGVGLLAFTGSEAAFVGSAALAGIAHGVLFPVMTSQVVHRARDSERGSALAAFTALFDLGLVTMAPIAGRLIDLSGYTAGFGTVGVSVLVGGVLYGLWDRHHAPAGLAPRPV